MSSSEVGQGINPADPAFVWPSQREYRIVRSPVIVLDDSHWRLPKKKGLHGQVGFQDPKTGEYIKLELTRHQTVRLAQQLLGQVL